MPPSLSCVPTLAGVSQGYRRARPVECTSAQPCVFPKATPLLVKGTEIWGTLMSHRP
ncbi:hypothetical protein P7K49_000219, partial [Saguinus oedipus]